MASSFDNLSSPIRRSMNSLALDSLARATERRRWRRAMLSASAVWALRPVFGVVAGLRLCTWCFTLVEEVRAFSKGLWVLLVGVKEEDLRWGIPLGRDWMDRLDLFLERALVIVCVEVLLILLLCQADVDCCGL
jgi:hypothetical protein